MPEITAKMVNELRAKTGLGMMECKKALVENAGDVQKSEDWLRKKGVKTSVMERASTEGRVQIATTPDKKTGAIAAINCTTDFAAKSETVGKVLSLVTQKLLQNPTGNVADDSQVKDALTSASQQTGENIQVGRTAVLHAGPDGQIGTYLYSITGKIGVLMQIKGNASDDLLKSLGGHIAFSKPVGLTRAEVPADLVEKEKTIAVEQAKATGKPQAIAEKIAEGKMNSFYAERVLLDQEFFNAQVFKGTVGNMLKQHGVTLEKYVLVEVGK